MGKLQTSVGYCGCGQEIWIEYIRKQQVWTPRFFARENEEITHCPECGKMLIDDELESL